MSLTKSVQFIDYYQVESDKKINQVLVDVNSIVLNQERILKHIEHLIQKRERRNPLNFFRQRTKSTPSQYGYLQPNEIDVVRGITEQTTYLGRSMKNVVSLQEQMLKMLEKDYTPMQDVKQQYEKRQNRREGPLVDRVLNKLRRKSRNAIIDARLFVLIKKEKLEDKIDELKSQSFTDLFKAPKLPKIKHLKFLGNIFSKFQEEDTQDSDMTILHHVVPAV